jgi:transposase InsO family protein
MHAYQLVDGESLDAILERRGRLAWETVADYAQQISSALGYAHAVGITHQDLMPEKILVTAEGDIKVIDFRVDRRHNATCVSSNKRTLQRVAQELSSRNKCCDVGRVGRLLREMGLKAIQPKSFRPRTTDSRHRLGYSPNLLLASAPPSRINHVWVGDITYIPLKNGDFLYLAMLLDLYSRRIVSWELRDRMKESLVLAALGTGR